MNWYVMYPFQCNVVRASDNFAVLDAYPVAIILEIRNEEPRPLRLLVLFTTSFMRVDQQWRRRRAKFIHPDGNLADLLWQILGGLVWLAHKDMEVGQVILAVALVIVDLERDFE
ncbi:hypothetical protein [Corynebacterium sp. NML180780]|uniref:hypothetical protein n=1 Tax=Corynebacterium sp. NML180780 TaxID=2598459 RepID=UPI00164848FF|nr:hypothetical protein [Corynebacterium sp. NML180780]